MDKIILHNFRCFSEQSMVFRPGVNLLIGDNASGKTSLLKACKYALAAFFAGFNDENTRWIGFEKGDFQRKIVNGTTLPQHSASIGFKMDDMFREDYEEYGYESGVYYVSKSKPNQGKMLREQLKKYSLFTSGLLARLFNPETGKQAVALPLFACFSTEDIHRKPQISEGKFKDYAPKNSFGYYECLTGYGLLDYWHKRMLVLCEGQENMEEIEIVAHAVASALGDGNGCGIIQGLEVRPHKKAIYYCFCDGREVEDDKLPDGYRRIVNIVVDIAFRCALLNRNIYGLDACSQTKGTVLIDEIDMHLHPSLQSVVLEALQNTFPHLQFIVSSHAPMVMSGVRNDDRNAVYLIRYEQGAEYSISEMNTYGLDMSTIVRMVLGIVPRNKDVSQRLDDLFGLIDDEKYDDAKILLADLRRRLGDNFPDLTKAETMLNLFM